jgi:hypothetical protein
MVDKFNFGEFVVNPDASPDNPTRYGFFVRTINNDGRLNPGTSYEITDGKGKFWTCRKLETPNE